MHMRPRARARSRRDPMRKTLVLLAAVTISFAAVAAIAPLPARGEVYNLKVVTDASPDYSDLDSLVHSATSNWKTDEEKLWALYYWTHIARRQTNPMILHGKAETDPIRQYND